MLFTDKLYIRSSAIHDMSSHIKYSFTSRGSCHHAKDISCKVIESWKVQSVVSPPLENVAATLYHKLSVVKSSFCDFHMH